MTSNKIATLETIKAELLQVIDQVRSIAHATDSFEDKLTIHRVSETPTTATSQIRHIADPNWHTRD
jgi:hypothetical protein